MDEEQSRQRLRIYLHSMLPYMAAIRCAEGVVAFRLWHVGDDVRLYIFPSSDTLDSLYVALGNTVEIEMFIDFLRNRLPDFDNGYVQLSKTGNGWLLSRWDRGAVLSDSDMDVLIDFLEDRHDLRRAPKFYPTGVKQLITGLSEG